MLVRSSRGEGPLRIVVGTSVEDDDIDVLVQAELPIEQLDLLAMAVEEW